MKLTIELPVTSHTYIVFNAKALKPTNLSQDSWQNKALC
ncbi:conserved hypothetical protein [Alteromonas sp. 38]|nr:conserved hypothetical protein [Alteromonas sp. 154]VXB25080.1 conserved hypothetical protein [Alteromonas sp. 38]